MTAVAARSPRPAAAGTPWEPCRPSGRRWWSSARLRPDGGGRQRSSRVVRRQRWSGWWSRAGQLVRGRPDTAAPALFVSRQDTLINHPSQRGRAGLDRTEPSRRPALNTPSLEKQPAAAAAGRCGAGGRMTAAAAAAATEAGTAEASAAVCGASGSGQIRHRPAAAAD